MLNIHLHSAGTSQYFRILGLSRANCQLETVIQYQNKLSGYIRIYIMNRQGEISYSTKYLDSNVKARVTHYILDTLLAPSTHIQVGTS